MKLLFIGDIMGSPGRDIVKTYLPLLKRKYQPAFVVVNGENSAHGRGITEKIAKELFGLGVHAITMGNHTWDNKEIFDYIDGEPRLIRPANFRRELRATGLRISSNQKESWRSSICRAGLFCRRWTVRFKRRISL